MTRYKMPKTVWLPAKDGEPVRSTDDPCKLEVGARCVSPLNWPGQSRRETAVWHKLIGLTEDEAKALLGLAEVPEPINQQLVIIRVQAKDERLQTMGIYRFGFQWYLIALNMTAVIMERVEEEEVTS